MAAPRPPPPKADNPLTTLQPLAREQMQQSMAREVAGRLEGSPTGLYASLRSLAGTVAGNLGQLPLCFCCPNPYKVVPQGTAGVISRWGILYKSVDPGLVKINPATEKVWIVDVRTQATDVPNQTVVTKDSATIRVTSTVIWKITNPFPPAYGLGGVRYALIQRVEAAVRDAVGQMDLQDVIHSRKVLEATLQSNVASASRRWGVTVELVALKSINLDHELASTLSIAAVQKRIGEARVIAAQAEVDAARLMREAADALATPAAMQIRALEYQLEMAQHGTGKTIYVPMNLVSVGTVVASTLASGKSTKHPEWANIGKGVIGDFWIGDTE